MVWYHFETYSWYMLKKNSLSGTEKMENGFFVKFFWKTLFGNIVCHVKTYMCAQYGLIQTNYSMGGAAVAAGRRVEAGGWRCGRVRSTRSDFVAARRMAPAAVYYMWWCFLLADGGSASPAALRSFGRGCGSDCVSLRRLRVLFALFWVSL